MPKEKQNRRGILNMSRPSQCTFCPCPCVTDDTDHSLSWMNPLRPVPFLDSLFLLHIFQFWILLFVYARRLIAELLPWFCLQFKEPCPSSFSYVVPHCFALKKTTITTIYSLMPGSDVTYKINY